MGPKQYRSEYRLYFPTTEVSKNASSGDLLVVAKCTTGTLLVIIAQAETTISNQVQWLFGIRPLEHHRFSIREELETEQDRLSFTSRFILEAIGVTVDDTEDAWLEKMLEQFDGNFPTTKLFSGFARSTLKDIVPLDCPDTAIMAWMDREELLFRTLERYLMTKRLQQGFLDQDKKPDIDGFLAYSLSIQNRRKSRAGFALENHLEELFSLSQVRFERGKITENRSKPDFLFPSQRDYQNPEFPAISLAMLGVKTTCKDRWRQVLSEADRIQAKHLLTLEPGISVNQTHQMKTNHLQIVLPRSLHVTYTAEQQNWLMGIGEFIEIIRQKQQKR